MKFLIFSLAIHAAEAKQKAAILRQRRHHAFIRDILAWAPNKEFEAADVVILLVDDEGAEHPAVAALADLYEKSNVEVGRLSPGEDLPEPSPDEEQVMTPLLQLRHDAALLGIEIDPAFDEHRLAGLIRERKEVLAKREADDEAKVKAAAEEADKAAKARAEEEAKAKAAAAAKDTAGEGANGNASDPGKGGEGPSGAPAEGEKTPDPAAPSTVEPAQSDPLEGVDVTNADALREFARGRNIPVNPNPRTKPETLLKSIRVALGG